MQHFSLKLGEGKKKKALTYEAKINHLTKIYISAGIQGIYTEKVKKLLQTELSTQF